MDKPIGVVGIKKLDNSERAEINKLLYRNFNKILVAAKKLDSLIIHVKTHKGKGKRKKYSIHLKAALGKRLFESDRAYDWNLSKAMHRAFSEVVRQLNRRFKE